MIRHFSTAAFTLFLLIKVAMVTPLNAQEKDTKLEDILYRGSVQELKDWLSANDNKITAKHKRIWDRIDFRYSFIMQDVKLRDPLTTEDEKNKAREEIRLMIENNLIITELVLKAADQKVIDLLNKASPPHQYPKLPFLYGICESSEIPKEAKMKFIELFVHHTKNKIWFDEFGLFMSFYSFLHAVSDKQAASCIELVADTFIREEDWPILENKEKLEALMKRIMKLYKR